jgi:hypothetical protein
MGWASSTNFSHFPSQMEPLINPFESSPTTPAGVNPFQNISPPPLPPPSALSTNFRHVAVVPLDVQLQSTPSSSHTPESLQRSLLDSYHFSEVFLDIIVTRDKLLEQLLRVLKDVVSTDPRQLLLPLRYPAVSRDSSLIVCSCCCG